MQKRRRWRCVSCEGKRERERRKRRSMGVCVREREIERDIERGGRGDEGYSS